MNKINDLENIIENNESYDSNDEKGLSNMMIFFPQKKGKYKGKWKYNEIIGEKNELKMYKENLLIRRKNK